MPAGILEPCPGCGAALPPCGGPAHRYIGASPACWQIYADMTGGGEPPVAPAPLGALVVDAYAAQHPGAPSPQAFQSVAVHLIALYGVLVRDVGVGGALWLRQEALSERRAPRCGRFRWLAPQPASYALTIIDIARAPDPAARAGLVRPYVEGVLSAWSALHGAAIAAWYDELIGA